MKLFVSTLPQPVRSRMLVTAVQSFSRLIAMGEEIESGLKKGWYGESGSSSKRFANKKDKEHVPEVNMTYVQKTPAQAPKLQFTAQQPASYKQQGLQDLCRQRKARQFTPLPGTLSQELTVLRKKNLLSSEPQISNSTGFARYDPSKKCDYHRGEVGHSTDDCQVLKHRVQDLLETGAFALQPAGKPNVQNNPLPDHSNSANVVLGTRVKQVQDFRVPFKDMFDSLVRAGYVSTDEVVSFGEIEKKVDELVRE